MIRPLVFHPNDILRAVAYDCNDSDKAAQVARDLLDTLEETKGHGLAAVQIGEMVQVFAAQDEGGVMRVYANPRILATSGSTKTREGCLSLPGVYGKVKRPRKIKVQMIEVDPVKGLGEQVILEMSGFAAVIVQHEIDHLNGILFIDKLIEPLET